MVRIGLVLGGGGYAGQAYHAGTLAALEHDTGWSGRDADVIVGTSAGSMTGALLRRGVAPSDLASWLTEAPDGTDAQHPLGRRPQFDPLTWNSVVRPPRLPAPQLMARALRAPTRVRALTVASTFVGDGTRTLLPHLEPLADMAWPERPLWIAAVRRRDGRRVVFGKDGPRVALVDVLAASCAVPGYFAPVRIHGHEYLDGGAHSSTNADVLAPEGLDLVVVIAPLAAAGTTPRSVDGVVHRIAARRLRQEIAALERTGTHVLVFEPGPDTVDIIGHDLMRSDVHDVVQASFLEAGARIAAAEYQSVRRLSTRGHRRAPVVMVPGGP